MSIECSRVTAQCIPSSTWGDYEVTCYDEMNNIVAQCATTCNGTAAFNVRSPGEYRIRARSKKPRSPIAITSWLYLCPNANQKIYFRFGSCCIKPCYTMARFNISDKNYDGLPIQEGVIQLCQVPI